MCLWCTGFWEVGRACGLASTRTSCSRTTHASGYYQFQIGQAVSVSGSSNSSKSANERNCSICRAEEQGGHSGLYTYIHKSKNNFILQPNKKKIKRIYSTAPSISVNAKQNKAFPTQMLTMCFTCIKRKIFSDQIGHFQNKRSRKCDTITYLQ